MGNQWQILATLSAYSCGGSRGLGPEPDRTTFPLTATRIAEPKHVLHRVKQGIDQAMKATQIAVILPCGAAKGVVFGMSTPF